LLFRLGAGDDLELARGPDALDPVAQILVGHRTSSSLLVIAKLVVGDERRKPRRRRYDQLPRKPAEPQHEAWARPRRAIEAADCAHDDASARLGRAQALSV